MAHQIDRTVVVLVTRHGFAEADVGRYSLIRLMRRLATLQELNR